MTLHFPAREALHEHLEECLDCAIAEEELCQEGQKLSAEMIENLIRILEHG